MLSSSKVNCKGLSLIEVLMALAIAALLSITGYRSLSGLIDAQSALHQHSEHWRELEQAMQWLQRDLQLYFRPVVMEGDGKNIRFTQLNFNEKMSTILYEAQGDVLRRNGDVILEGMAQCRFSYYRQGTWYSNQNRGDVQAVKLELTTTRGEQLTRLFYVP